MAGAPVLTAPTEREFDAALGAVVSKILRVADESPDARDLRPYLDSLVALMRSAPQLEELASERLVALLPRQGEQFNMGVREILEFTMHDLRFARVREAVQALEFSADDWRVLRPAQLILAAFEDEWPAGAVYEGD